MIEVKIGQNIHNLLNDSRLGIILSNVKVETTPEEYNEFLSKNYRKRALELESTRENELPVIKETRSAYKLCGKEPSRYRPSAEALLRRLRTKKELYRINNVVDSINLISVNTNYSIGGFDFKNIQGKIECDIGDSAIYQAIGRGELNIEFMPGLRDSQGFFGTPTSDSVRTKVNNGTTELLLVFYDFYGNDTLDAAMDFGEEIINSHCFGNTLLRRIITA